MAIEVTENECSIEKHLRIIDMSLRLERLKDTLQLSI